MRQLCSEMQNPGKKSDAKRYNQARKKQRVSIHGNS